jgi:hypothetical protein
MRTITFSIMAVSFIIFSEIIPIPVSAQQVSFQVFYDELGPYGQWVEDPAYGYIWFPDVGSDFMPYSTNGYWIWTDYGWTWASYYNWGWAPFHYGRWNYVDYYGWTWVPGEEWGPAWVAWRDSPGYYGWAPLTPGITVDVAIRGGFNIPPERWCFVHNQYMGRTDIHHYYGPRSSNQMFINNSTVIKNTYVDNSRHTTYICGPKREDVQKVTGKKIQVVPIKENSKPGQLFKNNELAIYRPAVSKGGTIVEKPRPIKVTDKKDIKPLAERKSQSLVSNRQSAVKKDAALQHNNNIKSDKTSVNKKQPINEKVKPIIKQNSSNKKAVQTENRKIQKQPVRNTPAGNPVNPNPVPHKQSVPAPKQQRQMQRSVEHANKPENIQVPRQEPMPREQQHKPH